VNIYIALFYLLRRISLSGISRMICVVACSLMVDITIKEKKKKKIANSLYYHICCERKDIAKSVPDTTDLGLYNEQMIKTDILFVDGSMSFIYPTILIHRVHYNWK
jgi:hypothetical protein